VEGKGREGAEKGGRGCRDFDGREPREGGMREGETGEGGGSFASLTLGMDAPANIAVSVIIIIHNGNTRRLTAFYPLSYNV